MQSGRKKDFIQALNYVEELYPNMAVLAQLANYLEDPNSSLEDVARLIRSEPALTVDIIKISNSSFYAATQKCSDVDTALTRIGFNEVLRVVALILAKDLCSQNLDKYGLSADELWEESLMVSLLMENLAKTMRLNKSKAATYGLLHSIGKVVINNILEDFRIDIYWDPTISLADWELAIAGFHHGEAGSRLLKRMEFPVEAQSVIRDHIEPEKANNPGILTYVLNYSAHLSRALGPGFMKTSFELPQPDWWEEKMNLPDEEIFGIIEEAKERFREITREVFDQ